VFRYVGDPDRYYPDSVLTANPGDVVEVAPAEDGRWVEIVPSTVDEPPEAGSGPPSTSDSAQKGLPPAQTSTAATDVSAPDAPVKDGK
jgi:hypothetical protein